MSLGLLHTATNAELDERNNAVNPYALQQQAKERAVFEQSLAGQIQRDWEEGKRVKQPVQERMLDCLRRRNGVYSADKLSEINEIGGSAIFMMLTSTKCRAAASWIRDILLPVTDKPWGLDPTPVSEIPPMIQQQLVEEIRAAATAQLQQGQPVGDVQAMMAGAVKELKKKATEAAKEASDKMELIIEDQLAEGGWTDSLEDFVEDFSTFPGAVLKAPVLRRETELAWQDGWTPIKKQVVRPCYTRVSPFDLYPSGDSVDPNTGSFIIERARYTRSQIQKMRGVPGYNEEAIDLVLTQYGMNGLRDWIWSDNERQSLEGKENTFLSSGETIDALVYHGSAIGLKLLQWGHSPDDIEPLEEYDIEAVLIGNHVVRAVIQSNPLDRRPYKVASYQNVPGAFWGTCPPELMSDIQDACNAIARNLINNLAIASGPQVEVNWDRLEAGEDAEMYPWKVWKTKSSSTTGNDPAVRFYQPSVMAGELMGVYEKFERMADDATNIPRYSYGNERVGGAGSTMGGLSMLMESANKGIKAAISHIDRRVIRPSIEDTWVHNMMYHQDNSIKGDSKVVARGSSAMLMRDRTQLMRQEFLQSTSNEIDMSIIGIENRARLLKTVADQLDIPNLIPDGEDLAAKNQQSQAMQQQIQQEQQKLETMIQTGKAMHLQAQTKKLLDSLSIDNEKTEAETQKILSEIERVTGEIYEHNTGQAYPGSGSSFAPAPEQRRLQNSPENGVEGASGNAGNPFRPAGGLTLPAAAGNRASV